MPHRRFYSQQQYFLLSLIMSYLHIYYFITNTDNNPYTILPNMLAVTYGQQKEKMESQVVFPKDFNYNIIKTRIFYNKYKFCNSNKRIIDEYWDVDWQREQLNLKRSCPKHSTMCRVSRFGREVYISLWNLPVIQIYAN